MTSLRSIPLAFAGLIGAAAFAVPSTAGPGPVRSQHRVAVDPAQVGEIVVPTAATLPGASYPWVEPVWIEVDGVTLPHVRPSLVASPGIQPVWKTVDGVALPTLS